jgi:hypothetical protein
MPIGCELQGLRALTVQLWQVGLLVTGLAHFLGKMLADAFQKRPRSGDRPLRIVHPPGKRLIPGDCNRMGL